MGDWGVKNCVVTFMDDPSKLKYAIYYFPTFKVKTEYYIICHKVLITGENFLCFAFG